MALRHWGIVVVFASGMAADPAFAAVETGGSVFDQAFVRLTGQTRAADTQFRSWTVGSEPFPAHDLSATATATQSDGAGDSATAFEAIQAHWASADSGSVTVPLRSWDVSVANTGDALVQLNTPASGRSDWTYDFTATHDGSFDMAFDLSGRGADLGLGAWDLLISDGNGSTQRVSLSQDFDFDPVHRTGSVSAALIAGHDYQVALVSDADVDFGQSDQRFLGDETDQFDWRITGDGAPEPGTWTLAILGFGLAGAALRRRGVRIRPA